MLEPIDYDDDLTADEPEDEPIDKTLEELAGDINEFHRQARDAMYSGAMYALKCGQALLAAKAQIEHGGWGFWVATNLDVTDRMARYYMAVAKNWPVIAEAKRKSISDLTLVGALAVLADFKAGDDQKDADDKSNIPMAPECRQARNESNQLLLGPGGVKPDGIAHDQQNTDQTAPIEPPKRRVTLDLPEEDFAEFLGMLDTIGRALNLPTQGATVLAVFRKVHANLDWLTSL